MKRNNKLNIRKYASYLVPLGVFFILFGFGFAVMENFATSYNDTQYSKMVSFSERMSTQIYETTMRNLSRITSIRDNYVLSQKQNTRSFEMLAQKMIENPNIHSLMILDKTTISKVYSKKDLSSLIGYDFAENKEVPLSTDIFISNEDAALYGPITLPNKDKILSVIIPAYTVTEDGTDAYSKILLYSLYFPDAYNNVNFNEVETSAFSFKIWTVHPVEGKVLTIMESQKPVSQLHKSNAVTFSRRAFTSTWFYTFEPHVSFYQTPFFYILAFIMLLISIIVPCAVHIIIKGIDKERTRKTLNYQLRLSSIQENTIYGLSNLVENRDSSTGDHVKRTSEYVTLLAKFASESGFYVDQLTEDYIQLLGKAAALHDIGKIVIPDNILKKPSKLTPEEFELIKTHTTEGAKILRDIFGPIQTKAFTNTAIEIASSHHERWDGKGYPSGLAGVTIPLSARFMSIADVFDALTTPRCYKKSFSFEDAISIIEEGKGSQFDPVITDIFLKNKNAFKEILDRHLLQFSIL